MFLKQNDHRSTAFLPVLGRFSSLLDILCELTVLGRLGWFERSLQMYFKWSKKKEEEEEKGTSHQLACPQDRVKGPAIS